MKRAALYRSFKQPHQITGTCVLSPLETRLAVSFYSFFPSFLSFLASSSPHIGAACLRLTCRDTSLDSINPSTRLSRRKTEDRSSALLSIIKIRGGGEKKKKRSDLESSRWAPGPELGVQPRWKIRISGLMSSGDLFVRRLFILGNYTEGLFFPFFFFLSRGKGYFQRMNIEFPLDLRIIKEHNTESSPLPPADF